MSSQQSTLQAFTDAAADAIARAIAGVQRDAQRERELRDAEHRARLAEIDVLMARVRGTERDIETRLASIKDGQPGEPGPRGLPGDRGADADMDIVRGMINEAVEAAVAALPPPPPGKDADPERIAEAVAAEVARIPAPAPGKDADMGAVRSMIEELVAAIPPAPAGKDADPAVIEEMVARAVAALPPPLAGKDADPEVIRQMVNEAVSQLPPAEKGDKGDRGEPGAPGLLPLVKEWEDRVYYAGMVALHEGSTYQANCDTGRAPPHEDWRCIARAGRDGSDGRSFRVRGTHADGDDYDALDVVVLNGAAFVAKSGDPGACPGEGWQMIAAQGKRGAPGPRGDGVKGDRGDPGPAVVAMDVDGDGLFKIRNADGTIVECDLYPLLSQLVR